MKATAWEFRLRYWIHVAIYVLGFAAPWDRWLHLDSIRAWQWIASWPARSGWLSFSSATIAVLVAGIVLAFVAAALRTWASAYLGASVVHHAAMHGEQVVANGPYRRLRNPLYLGTFLHTLALALLMPTSGAIFTVVLIGLFQWRLMLAEEAFLGTKLGESYRQYCTQVPRLLPALRPRVPESGARGTWGTAFWGEIYMWGVFVSFAALGWRYNSILILQGVLISLGVSLVARGFGAKPQAAV
jgi:protein-S-isoprenylcysteine O-methyltransferase Ste14